MSSPVLPSSSVGSSLDKPGVKCTPPPGMVSPGAVLSSSIPVRITSASTAGCRSTGAVVVSTSLVLTVPTNEVNFDLCCCVPVSGSRGVGLVLVLVPGLSPGGSSMLTYRSSTPVANALPRSTASVSVLKAVFLFICVTLPDRSG